MLLCYAARASLVRSAFCRGRKESSDVVSQGPALDQVEALEWRGGRSVRHARVGAALYLQLPEVTSQARVYKKVLAEAFRDELRAVRPRYGDFTVEIRVELAPGLPRIDLDNIAKAVLDGVKGAVFFDDAQVARLVVERVDRAVERVLVRVFPQAGADH